MGCFKRFFDDYFDDRAKEISDNGGNDFDIYDDNHNVNNPGDETWRGSDVHYNPYGTDPTFPDANDVNQD